MVYKIINKICDIKVSFTLTNNNNRTRGHAYGKLVKQRSYLDIRRDQSIMLIKFPIILSIAILFKLTYYSQNYS